MGATHSQHPLQCRGNMHTWPTTPITTIDDLRTAMTEIITEHADDQMLIAWNVWATACELMSDPDQLTHLLTVGIGPVATIEHVVVRLNSMNLADSAVHIGTQTYEVFMSYVASVIRQLIHVWWVGSPDGELADMTATLKAQLRSDHT